jgi:hypothetical protein
MRVAAISLVCALLSACQTVPTEPPAPPAALAFEVKSWGALVHSWSVAADGVATAVTRQSNSGSPWPPYTLEHRRFTLAAADLAKLQSLAAALPNPEPTDDKCQQRMTDAAYGSLSIARGAEARALKFYEGCFDAYYAPYIAQVKAIDALVMDAAEKAPIERRDEVAGNSD